MMAPTPLAALARSTLEKDELVTLIVDKSGKSFKVQRSILTSASPWFVKALAPERFREGQELQLRLHGVKQEVVECFLFWLYKGEIPFDQVESRDEYTNSDLARTRMQQALAVRLWLFGDRHFLPAIQNRAMDELRHFIVRGVCVHCEMPSLELLREAYEHSLHGSPLRMFVTGVVLGGLQIHHGLLHFGAGFGYSPAEIEGFAVTMSGFTADMTSELVLMSLQQNDPSIWRGSGKYHVDEDISKGSE